MYAIVAIILIITTPFALWIRFHHPFISFGIFVAFWIAFAGLDKLCDEVA